jgi:type II secretory pathway pseudopilin PulG
MRPLRTRLAAEDGFTLIELLVTALIGMVVISAALLLTEVAGRSAARVEDRVETSQRARIAMDRIVRQLRTQACLNAGTPPIVSGDANQVTFYSDYDALAEFIPQKRRLVFGTTGDGSIVEDLYQTTSTQAPWGFPTAPTRTRTLLTHVGRDGSTPFLRYYSRDVSGPLTTPLNSDISTIPLPVNSIAKVVRVEVTFEAGPTSGRPGPERRSRVNSTVSLRNADYAVTDSAGNTWGPRCA